MVHFTCDLCGKDLTESADSRFVVKIEVSAGFDPNQIREDDLDDDPMEAVAELIQRDAELGSQELGALVPKGFRFDLCSVCRCKFVKDPLGRDTVKLLAFSQN